MDRRAGGAQVLGDWGRMAVVRMCGAAGVMPVVQWVFCAASGRLLAAVQLHEGLLHVQTWSTIVLKLLLGAGILHSLNTC